MNGQAVGEGSDHEHQFAVVREPSEEGTCPKVCHRCEGPITGSLYACSHPGCTLQTVHGRCLTKQERQVPQPPSSFSPVSSPVPSREARARTLDDGEQEDTKTRWRLHSENAFLLFSGIRQSTEMMNKRLQETMIHQQKLQEEEREFKAELKKQWNEISQVMENYLNNDCDYMSSTVEAVERTVNAFSSVIGALQEKEISLLASIYRSQSGSSTNVMGTKFAMVAPDLPSSPGGKRPPNRLMKSKSVERGDYNQDMESLAKTIRREGTLNFSAEFPRSMHQLGEALLSCTQLNNTLQRCLNIRRSEDKAAKGQSLLSLLRDLQKSAETCQARDQQYKQSDQYTAALVEVHHQVLKNLQDMVTIDPPPPENIDNYTPPALHEKIIHPHTGKLTIQALEAADRLSSTSNNLVIQQGQAVPLGNCHPLLISDEHLYKQSSTFTDKSQWNVDQVVNQLVDVREENVIKLTSLFLLSYRYLMRSEDLLERLIYRYCAVPHWDEPNLSAFHSLQSSTRLRTMVFIKAWITQYFTDFQEPRAGRMLRQFIEDVVVYTGNQMIARQLLKLLDSHHGKDLVVTDIPRDISPPSTSVLEYDPRVFAEQLTVFQHQKFANIKEIELLQQHYSKDKAPHVSVISDHFNQLGGWVLLQVLTQSSLEDRVSVMKQLIAVSVHLYQLKNYNGTVAIIAALNNAAIDRLRITWQTLKRPLYLVKEALSGLIASNYSAYRKELKEITPPCVPFLGMFLTDLTFLEDGNPNFVDNDKVNISGKFSKISSIVHQLLDLQEFAYHDITLDTSFVEFFRSLPVLSEQEAFTRSEKVEPRKLTSTVKKPEPLSPTERADVEQIRHRIRSNSVTCLDDLLRSEEEESTEESPQTHTKEPKAGKKSKKRPSRT